MKDLREEVGTKACIVGRIVKGEWLRYQKHHLNILSYLLVSN